MGADRMIGRRRAFLGAGSRDGDRLAHLAEALRRLAGGGVGILRVSWVYETEPVGLPPGPTLLNGAVQVATDLPAEGVLAACLDIEAAMGRRRARPEEEGSPEPGPRPIDLDLLLYEEDALASPRLVVPHPRMHLRRFVLEPLAEIAAGARHPVLDRTVSELLAACGDAAWVRRAHPPAAWWAPPTDR